MKQILIVDGYNMIGAWPELRQVAEQSLEDARDILIEMLANYQGYSGKKIIIVFDAYQVPGLGVTYDHHRLDIRYTKAKETADECIERLVTQLTGRRTQVFVATSDHVEQSVTFGKGALRISARELQLNIQESEQKIKEHIHRESVQVQKRNTFDSKLSHDLKKKLEKWRRGDRS